MHCVYSNQTVSTGKVNEIKTRRTLENFYTDWNWTPNQIINYKNGKKLNRSNRGANKKKYLDTHHRKLEIWNSQ